jgi:hypothetical protein
MGLLDDAIREHLDLKRRRGADPTEVARLEQEALGPVRREPTPAEAAAAEEQHEEPRAEAAPAQAEHPHPAAEDLHPDEHTHVLPPEDRHEPPHGDPLFEQHAHNVEMGGAAAELAARPESAESEPKPEAPQEDPDHADVVDQPTTEYRVEDHHDDDEHEEPQQAGEDVLEETPDFLQETPEHDRLWFEQRPPRDFDFDG